MSVFDLDMEMSLVFQCKKIGFDTNSLITISSFIGVDKTYHYINVV